MKHVSPPARKCRPGDKVTEVLDRLTQLIAVGDRLRVRRRQPEIVTDRLEPRLAVKLLERLEGRGENRHRNRVAVTRQVKAFLETGHHHIDVPLTNEADHLIDKTLGVLGRRRDDMHLVDGIGVQCRRQLVGVAGIDPRARPMQRLYQRNGRIEAAAGDQYVGFGSQRDLRRLFHMTMWLGAAFMPCLPGYGKAGEAAFAKPPVPPHMLL